MTSANTFDAVMGRLLTASNSRNDSELARALGITPQSVSGARKRGEVPPAWIQSYAEKTGVCSDWLFFGRGPMRLDETPPAPQPEASAPCDVDLILIPMVEARLSAGQGSLQTDGNSERSYAFRSDFLHRKGNPDNMVLMRVSGDSMQPEILNNDVVLLDQSKTDILPGRIYAVGFEEAIYLKRVDMLPGKVILKSANPAYPPVELDIRDQQRDAFRVIGQVLWSGREY
ncbi:MAG: S24 family peptidase [Desulfovibrio sp.]|uniref:LexA family transcriptional regulator n=1 Tax=Desulfovibrio TaxID=872 RepID=UPI0020514C8D|nr:MULTISPECIES: S24 family peptidase [Desulfovibrio]MDY5430140.1 S24 family peptidase [Desulfovibrio sp.]MEE0070131.1 S24 family peptidase [Desulfovibrio sp.]DAL11777.1 MAG TPA_asm: Repressor protein CI [Caudoviricetes sp.]